MAERQDRRSRRRRKAEAPPPRHPDEQRWDLAASAQRTAELEGLDKANAAKRAQYELRTRLRAGELDDIALLEGNGPPELQAIADGVKVRRLLPWLEQIGPSRTQQLLEIMYLTGHVRLGDLPFERRLHLARFVLTMRAGHYVHAPLSAPQTPPPEATTNADDTERTEPDAEPDAAA